MRWAFVVSGRPKIPGRANRQTRKWRRIRGETAINRRISVHNFKPFT